MRHGRRKEAFGLKRSLPCPKKLGIADSDLSSLLMNMLDNAVRGCETVIDPAKRYICLNISKRETTLQYVAKIHTQERSKATEGASR